MSFDKRHNARVLALQSLFEQDFFSNSIQVLDHTKYFSIEELVLIDDLTNYDKDLLNQIIVGVKANINQIDKIITKLASQWPIEQIAKTDLNILRIAIFEGFIAKITPEKVAIDEALELAREFATETSRIFINGVLGNLIKDSKKYVLD